MLARAIVAACVFAVVAGAASAQNFTPQTEKLLKDMKLAPAVMDGLDRELAVPGVWIEGAKKEGLVKIRTTLNDREFDNLWPVFAERYPGIKLEYKHAVGRERAIAPLLAFKTGTILSDVLFAFDSNEQDYREARALASLTDLPGWNNVDPEVRAPDGIWIGAHGPHYCLSYNTKTVRKEDMPRTWDDLLTNLRWRGGKVGMAVNVHTWILPLSRIYGEAWADDYMKRLFRVVRPQLRKENLSMTPRLNALGEFDISVPAGDYAVWPNENAGQTVSFHCPDVVPKGNSSFGIMAGTPRMNAAKLFVNWAISKEGQIALARAGQILPQHKDLQTGRLMPYPKEIVGKTIVRLDTVTRDKTPVVVQKWHELWMSAGGPAEGGN